MQAQALGTRVHELRVKTEQIEELVADATARPVELIAAAQTEAAQLERVCQAVRKVFAGLSNASLEAKQRVDVIEKLSQQTDRASLTLQEWIEEAVRVQGRLERTLDRAPSIRQTHSGEALLSASRGLASSRLRPSENHGHAAHRQPRPPSSLPSRTHSAT